MFFCIKNMTLAIFERLKKAQKKHLLNVDAFLFSRSL